MLEDMLTREGDDFVFGGGTVLAGVAHWQNRPRA